jgi:hypothetical protein
MCVCVCVCVLKGIFYELLQSVLGNWKYRTFYLPVFDVLHWLNELFGKI